MLQSIWKSKKDESYMIIKRGNTTDDWGRSSENWEKLYEFFTFKNDAPSTTTNNSIRGLLLPNKSCSLRNIKKL